jgi:glutamate:GABA antiporter
VAEAVDGALGVGATAVSDRPRAVHLRRALGQRDLVFLFVVAVVNINNVPVIAASGAVTVWMWVLALALFFLPQGVAVIELSERYPHEGGVYLWTREIFGNFHGFMSGWCYWTNNMFYIPTLVLCIVGISVFMGGPAWYALGDDKHFVPLMAVAVLWLITAINILGLNVGKWINNLGGIGSIVATLVLVGLAIAVSRSHGVALRASDFRVSTFNWGLVGAFAFVCNSCTGLELPSAMGDEIRDPRRTLPRAVLSGGLIAGALYIAVTLAVLLAMPANEIGAVQGIMQAADRMAGTVGVASIVAPLALILTVAVAGTTSAWVAGSARIPFVAGLDHYLPSVLGRLHPRFATPHVALILQGVVSCAVLAMGFVGSTVQEGYRILLLLAIVVQLIPFLYMFAALLRLAGRPDFRRVRHSRKTLLAAGAIGSVVTGVGIVVAFVPPEHGAPAIFEAKMVTGTLLLLALGATIFYRSGPSRAAAARNASA